MRRLTCNNSIAYLKNWTDNFFQIFFMGTSWVAVSINNTTTRASREMTSRKNINILYFNGVNVAKHWHVAGRGICHLWLPCCQCNWWWFIATVSVYINMTMGVWYQETHNEPNAHLRGVTDIINAVLMSKIGILLWTYYLCMATPVTLMWQHPLQMQIQLEMKLFCILIICTQSGNGIYKVSWTSSNVIGSVWYY